MSEQVDVWQFPMDFPIKVMGLHREGFIEEVIEVVQVHAPDDYNPKHAPSASGKYLSVTLVIRAESREQIDNIYKAVWTIDGVKYVL